MREFDEPISPELVLVSPAEVAERARALLVDAEVAHLADLLEPATEQKPIVSVPLPAPEVDRAPVGRFERRRRTSRRLVAALITSVLALAAAIVVFERRPASAPSTSPTSEVLGAQSPTRTSSHAKASRSERGKAERPAARQTHSQPARRRLHVAPATTKQPHARRIARPKKQRFTKSARLRTSTPFVPARLFTWPERRDARAYIVRFFRNGKKVLQLRAKRPQVALPKGFRFKAGTYRWQVIPVGGGANGEQPIVDSTFVLTAATAARAP